MRTPFLKEPLPAPWWAFLYTFHHWMWCELHYGPAWHRLQYRRLQYDTTGGIILVGLAYIAVAFVLYWIIRTLKWLLITT